MKRAVYGIVVALVVIAIFCGAWLFVLAHEAAKIFRTLPTDFRSIAALSVAVDLQRRPDWEVTLILLAAAWRADRQNDWQAQVHQRHAIAVLCRMLFEPPEGQPFRRPALGATTFLDGTSYSDWPLEPIEIVDGSPFYIAQGYMGAGLEFSALAYTKYCIREMRLRRTRYTMRTTHAVSNACEALINRQWSTPLMEREKAFLRRQTEPAHPLEPSQSSGR